MAWEGVLRVRDKVKRHFCRLVWAHTQFALYYIFCILNFTHSRLHKNRPTHVQACCRVQLYLDATSTWCHAQLQRRGKSQNSFLIPATVMLDLNNMFVYSSHYIKSTSQIHAVWEMRQSKHVLIYILPNKLFLFITVLTQTFAYIVEECCIELIWFVYCISSYCVFP